MDEYPPTPPQPTPPQGQPYYPPPAPGTPVPPPPGPAAGPPAAPPAAAQTYSPPPPAPPATPPEAPPQPVGRPPRKRRAWLIPVIVVLIACCAIATIAGAFVGYGVYQRGQTADRLKAADQQFNKATDSVSKASEALRKFDFSASQNPGTDAKAAVKGAADQLDAASAALAGAKTRIEPIGPGPVSSAYLGGLREADAGLASLKAMVGYLGDFSGQAQAAVNAGKIRKTALTELNDAIKAANQRRWDAAISKAAEASRDFKKAQDLFNAAHKIDPTAGFDAAAAWAAKERQQADLIKEMATHGKSGATAAYNKDVDAVNALSTTIANMKQPAIITDPNWVEKRFGGFEKEITAHMDKAGQLIKEAHTLFDQGK